MTQARDKSQADARGCVFYIGAGLLCWGAYLCFGIIPAGACLMAVGLFMAAVALLG